MIIIDLDEVFVESGDHPLITSKEYGEGNFSNFDFKEVVAHRASSIKSYTDLDATVTTRDKR